MRLRDRFPSVRLSEITNVRRSWCPPDSLSEIAFDDGLFKDEADLNSFVRWILRCQAKREAGTLEP